MLITCLQLKPNNLIYLILACADSRSVWMLTTVGLIAGLLAVLEGVTLYSKVGTGIFNPHVILAVVIVAVLSFAVTVMAVCFVFAWIVGVIVVWLWLWLHLGSISHCEWEWVGLRTDKGWFVLIVMNLRIHSLKTFSYLRARWLIQWQQAPKKQLPIRWDTWYSVHRTVASCYWHALMDTCDKMYL